MILQAKATFQDLSLETANREGATYVLAQDPDADRFSAAQKLCECLTSLFGFPDCV